MSTFGKQIHGEVAIASAKAAYQIYKETINSERFEKLTAKGARVQRLLWASTSTKNPTYSKVKYIDGLIGPQTVNTVPIETLQDYLTQGDRKLLLEQDVDKADWILQQLPELGIDIEKVTNQLEAEGVEKFIKSFDQLMETLKRKMS